MDRKGGTARELIYAVVNAPIMMMYIPAVGILPTLYAKYGGLSLVAIGSILMVMRVLDAVIDPFIGFMSDGTRSRFGRRKPWILAGAIVVGFGALMAFQPSASTGYLYFGMAYFLLVVGWSLMEIPHTAWVNELTGDYQGRSRLAAYRFVAGMVGQACFVGLPLLPIFATTEVTPEVASLAAWVIVAWLVLTVPLALLFVPDASAASAPQQMSLRHVLRSVSGNRPFWFIVAMQSLGGLSSGIVGGLFFLYLVNYLNIGSKYSYVMLPVMVLSVVGALFWLRVTVSVDKHRVWALCSLVTAATNIAMFCINPGDWAAVLLISTFAVSAFSGAGRDSALVSLTADVVDYGTLASGGNFSGNYFAASSFINKFCLAVGGGLGLVIAGLFGYTAQGPNGQTAMLGFFLAIIWIPCALNVAAALFAWRFPITREGQAAIRRELDLRAKGEAPLPKAEGANAF